MLTTICASAAHLRTTMRFGGMRWYEESSMASVNAISPEFEVHNYTQSLDHFNFKPESYATFQQRYILNYKYWGGANTSSPIFVYLGAEIDVTQNLDLSIVDLAARFKGLLLYIEVISKLHELGCSNNYCYRNLFIYIHALLSLQNCNKKW
jgi:lysosomal Pro-X carboxypeptidase